MKKIIIGLASVCTVLAIFMLYGRECRRKENAYARCKC